MKNRNLSILVLRPRVWSCSEGLRRRTLPTFTRARRSPFTWVERPEGGWISAPGRLPRS